MAELEGVDKNILAQLTGEVSSSGDTTNGSDNGGNNGGDDNGGAGSNGKMDNGNGGQNGSDLKIPKELFSVFGINEEEFKPEKDADVYLMLAETARKKYIEQLPPLARFVIEHANDPAFDEKVFATKIAGQTQQLTPEQKLQEYLYEKYGGRYDEENNPSGLTEQDVKDFLSSKNKIELKELLNAAENHFASKKGETLSEYEKYLQAENEKRLNAIIAEQQENAKRILEKVKEINSVYGVNFSEDERKQFDEVFPTLITPSKETGMAPLLEMIYSMDDEQLYKLAYILYAKEESLANKVNEKINASKKKIIEKIEGSNRRRSQSTSSDDGVDIRKLSMPE